MGKSNEKNIHEGSWNSNKCSEDNLLSWGFHDNSAMEESGRGEEDEYRDQHCKDLGMTCAVQLGGEWIYCRKMWAI